MAEIRDQYILDIDQALRASQQVTREIESIETSIRETAGVTGDIETDFQGVARALGVSEQEASGLTNEILEAQQASRRAEAEIRDVADALGLSERDARDLAQQMQRVSTEARQADQSTDRLSGSLGRVRGLLVAGVAAVGLGAVVRQFDDAVASASDLEQSIGGVQSVFGEASTSVLTFGENAAQSVGLANDAANTLAARLGGQLQTFGFDAAAAATETQNLIGLGADLAATYGGPVSDAVEAVSSLLRGEANPIERYAVAINQSTINAEALRQGLAETTSEITIQDKAVAALALLYEQTGNAQGQFNREASTTAGQLERLRAEAENTRAEFGEALTPAFLALIDAAPALLEGVESLIPAVEDFAAVIAEVDFAAGVDGLRTFGNTASGVVSLLQGDLASATGSGFINDFSASLDAGIDPAEAFLGILNKFEGLRFDVATFLDADEVARVVDQLQNFADLDAADLVRILQQFQQGTAADFGFTEAEFEGITNALRDLIDESADFDIGPNFSRGARGLRELDDAADSQNLLTQLDAFNLLADASDTTGVSIQRLVADYDTLSPELQEAANVLDLSTVKFLEQGAAIEELSGDIGALQGSMDAAAQALRDSEGEIVSDFSSFFDNLQEELQNREAFESNLAILRSFGLDNLAEVFDEAGTDAADALADAVANLDQARTAEADLEGKGADLGSSVVSGITTAIQDGELETGDALIDNIINAAAQADTPQTRQALIDLAEQLRLEIPVDVIVRAGAGAGRGGDTVRDPANPYVAPPSGQPAPQGGGNTYVSIELQSTGDTATDATRAAQALGNIR